MISHAIRRGEKTKRNRFIQRGTTVLAACIAFFLLIQVPSVSATFMDIPIIGTIVKTFQIGEGGSYSDGISADLTSENTKLKLYFTHHGTSVNYSPSYKVEKKVAPYRIEILIEGVRHFRYDDLDVNTLDGVKDLYKNITLSDSAFSFVLELKDNMDYEISEYKEPGYLELTLKPNEIEPENIYFLKSKPMKQGEVLSLLQEKYDDEGASIVKTKEGEFVVVIGEYSNEEEANRKLEEIQQRKDYKDEFQLDRCYSNENPEG